MKNLSKKTKKGEFSRFYYSTNSRNQEKVKKAMLHYLLDNDLNMAAVNTVTVSLAMQIEQAETKHWMFDYDSEENLREFLVDLGKAISSNPSKISAEVEVKKILMVMLLLFQEDSLLINY